MGRQAILVTSIGTVWNAYPETASSLRDWVTEEINSASNDDRKDRYDKMKVFRLPRRLRYFAGKFDRVCPLCRNAMRYHPHWDCEGI